MKRILALAGAAAALGLALTAPGSMADQGTSCKTGYSSLYVGPTSQFGYLARQYDKNGDNYICQSTDPNQNHQYTDNHFQATV